jgi:hypothetical protein
VNSVFLDWPVFSDCFRVEVRLMTELSRTEHWLDLTDREINLSDFTIWIHGQAVSERTRFRRCRRLTNSCGSRRNIRHMFALESNWRSRARVQSEHRGPSCQILLQVPQIPAPLFTIADEAPHHYSGHICIEYIVNDRYTTDNVHVMQHALCLLG